MVHVEGCPYKELGDFLTRRRHALLPEQVGLPCAGSRRRTVGLRREEVATLIGCSVDWYTQLEQGRSKPSLQLLERIAEVLHLTPAERTHLLHLADVVPAPSEFLDHEKMTPTLQRLLDQLDPAPAYIIGQRWDVIGWNRSACQVFVDFEKMNLRERNVVYFMFMNPILPQIIVDWESHARRVLREFRADYGKYREHPSFVDLIEYLTLVSADFRAWWHAEGVDEKCQIRKEVHHKLGTLTFEQSGYSVMDTPNLRLITYIPLDQATKQRLACLWLAEEQVLGNGVAV